MTELALPDQNELAMYQREGGGVVGLDEIDAGDLVTPRFAIDHNKGVWVNSLNNQEYSGFTAILLCRVKQRIMWKPKLEDNSDPRCRSNNFRMGFPNVNPKSKQDDLFPWSASVFNPSDYPPDAAHNNLPVLPCDTCTFKNWENDDKPSCKEQWTFAALAFLATPANANGEWVPVLFTIQGTGLKSIRPYISEFIQRRSPLFTQMTAITLKAEQKGRNTYYIPIFSASGGTSQDSWRDYASKTEMFQGYLKQDPRNQAGTEAQENAQPQQPQAPNYPEPPAQAQPQAPQQTQQVPQQAPANPSPPAQPEQPQNSVWEDTSQPDPQVYDAEVVDEPVANQPQPAAPAAPQMPAAAPPPPPMPAPAAPAAPAPAAQAAPAPAPAPAAAPAQPAPAAPAPAPEAQAPAPTVAPGKLPF